MSKLTARITGHDAIRIAERDGVTLHKSADPIEWYGIVDIALARDIAKIDASLIYCIVQPVGWVGDGTGHNVTDYFRGCLDGHAMSGATYLGPDEDGVEPTWTDVEADWPTAEGAAKIHKIVSAENQGEKMSLDEFLAE